MLLNFIFQGYSSFTQNLITAAVPQTAQQSQQLPMSGSSSTPNPPIKTEDLSTLIAGFTKSIIDVIHSTQPQSQPQFQDRKMECNYCREEHFICDCPHVNTDIKAGKCRRNQEGKVVLSTGSYVP